MADHEIAFSELRANVLNREITELTVLLNELSSLKPNRVSRFSSIVLSQRMYHTRKASASPVRVRRGYVRDVGGADDSGGLLASEIVLLSFV
jgi:hypothetical protein